MLGFSFVNCVLANINALGTGVGLSGNNNGFHGCDVFGTGQYGPYQTLPFSTSGSGQHYLSSLSGFKGVGTTAIDPNLLADLNTRTTDPPSELGILMQLTGQLTLSTQAPRYVSGAPNLGYYYDVLDYTVFDIQSEQASITVLPGTAIAVRNDLLYDSYSPTGFLLWENSKFISHGSPDNPITYTETRSVQEGPFEAGAPVVAFEPFFLPYANTAPALSFRFCNFYFHQPDYLISAGLYGAWGPSQVSSLYWSLQDCTVRGGFISLGPGAIFGAPSYVFWRNTSFDQVGCYIYPDHDLWYPLWPVDFGFQACNNLMRDSYFYLWQFWNTHGNWTIRDNLFEDVVFSQDIYDTLNHDFNAYWSDGPLNSQVGVTSHLISDSANPSAYAPNDQQLTAPPAYQGGPLGTFYLPPGSLNIDGSETTAQAGLSTYTTRYDQSADGNNPRIGLHYIATQSGLSKVPKDSQGHGVPDYVTDADGNGVPDANDASIRLTQANNDAFQVQQDSGQNQIAPLVNDTDTEGFPLTIFYPIGPTATSHATVVPAADFCSLIYTPFGGFYGVDTITYAIVNNFDRESSASASVFVNKTGNHQPIASGYQITMPPSGNSIVINPLANDSDPDGDPLTLFAVRNPQLGTVTLAGNSIQYSRSPLIYGTDSFTYVVTDGKGGCAIGLIQVNRDTGGNHVPVATSYSTTAVSGTAVTLPLVATDADADPLTYTILSGPTHGAYTRSGATVTYTPDNMYYGPDAITFKVNDGHVDSASARITIHVQILESLPLANPISLPTRQNTPVAITLSGWDQDGDYLTFARQSNPAHGTVSGMPPNLTYTPYNGYLGWDNFTFTANDGKWDSGLATVAINVLPPVPTTTVANRDYFEVDQNSGPNSLDVLANDADSQDLPLTITSTSLPAHGTVTIAADSLSLDYTPSAATPPGGFYGDDTFTYTISNGQGRTATGTVIVFVNKSGNGDPNPAPFQVTLPIGATTVTIAKADILNNCSDPDADALSIYSFEQPNIGTAIDNGSGGIAYTRAAGEFGTDAFTCAVTDGNGGYGTITVMVNQTDTDADGMPDDWEIAHGLDPNSDDSLAVNSDGLPNWAEYKLKNDPQMGVNPLNIAIPGGCTLSGTVNIPIAVRPDVDSAEPINIYINGGIAVHATVSKSASGWTCLLDTTCMPNGSYEVQLGLSRESTDPQNSSAVGMPAVARIENPITFDNLTSTFESELLIRANLNIPADSYRVDLYDQQGSFVKAITGNTFDGSIDKDWDLTDDSGSIIVNDSLNARVTLANSQAGQVAQEQHDFYFEGPSGQQMLNAPTPWLPSTDLYSLIKDRNFVVAYAFNDLPPQDQTAMQQTILNSVVNILGSPAWQSPYTLLPWINEPTVSAYRYPDTAKAHDTLLSILGQGDNFFWLGHGSTETLGGMTPGMYWNSIFANQVARKLHNNIRASNPRHLYRLVFLYSCGSYSKDWAEAFGIRPFTTTPAGQTAPISPWKMDDYIAVGREPRAFVGWWRSPVHPVNSDSWASFMMSFADFFDHWMAGYPLDSCLSWFNYWASYPEMKDWGISGCTDLTRTQFQ
jgi:hypothetical protein